MRLPQRQRDNKRGAGTRSAAGGNRAPVPFGNLAAYRKSDPGPLVSTTRVKPLKDTEDPVQVLFLKTDPVVTHQQAKDILLVPHLPFYLYDRDGVRVTEFQRVGNQVLDELT